MNKNKSKEQSVIVSNLAIAIFLQMKEVFGDSFTYQVVEADYEESCPEEFGD